MRSVSPFFGGAVVTVICFLALVRAFGVETQFYSMVDDWAQSMSDSADRAADTVRHAVDSFFD